MPSYHASQPLALLGDGTRRRRRSWSFTSCSLALILFEIVMRRSAKRPFLSFRQCA